MEKKNNIYLGVVPEQKSEEKIESLRRNQCIISASVFGDMFCQGLLVVPFSIDSGYVVTCKLCNETMESYVMMPYVMTDKWLLLQ